MVGLCERFRCLPREGGLLDQDVRFLRLVKIFDLAHPREDPAADLMG